MPFTYKIKKSYLAPTHFFVNAGFFNYFEQLQNPLITLSKWRFQLRYACFSPWMDNWSLHTCLASLGSTKPTCCTDYNPSSMQNLKKMQFWQSSTNCQWIPKNSSIATHRSQPFEFVKTFFVTNQALCLSLKFHSFLVTLQLLGGLSNIFT